MSIRQILEDPFLVRYRRVTLWNTFYTCIPVDKKETSYECVSGLLDTCWTMNEYDQSKWLETSVPFYIPSSFHESHLNGKMPDRIVRIIK